MNKKWIRRIIVSCGIALTAMLCVSYVALAAPASVTNFVSTSITSTSISLSWIPASGSTSTVIRYSTVTYPTTPAGGTAAYSGSLNYATVSGLTAGTTYYFSAWGYDGANYSATSTPLALSTLSTTSGDTTIPFANPAMPASVYQDPSITGWSWHPLDDIVEYFSDNATAHGGLGMTSNNVMMFIIGVAVTGIGLLTYIKWHTFFASWFIVLVLSGLFSMMHIMQWMVFIFLLIVGAGVWAIEKNFQ